MAREPSAAPELLSLLRAAREAPGDLSRRRLVADWLERHDDVGLRLVRIRRAGRSRPAAGKIPLFSTPQ